MDKQNYSLRMSIISAFALLFVFLISLIIGFNYYTGHKMAMQTAEDVFQQAGKTAINKTVDFLEPAMHSAKIFERIIDKKHINPKEIAEVHDYCLQVLRVYTQFNACFYANEYGLWGAEYGKDKLVDLVSRYRNDLSDRQSIAIDVWIDQKDKIVREKKFMSDFDSRIRPWYINVKKTEKPYWTEPYLFFNEQIQIGVSAAVPIFDEKKFFAGSTLVDITMDALSEFLRNLKVSKNSLAFIIDEHGKLVCFPDMSVAIHPDSKNQRLRNIIELKDYKTLISAYAEHSKEGKARVIVDGKSGSEIVQFIPFPESFGKKWKMVVSAKESDFTDELNAANEFSILVSFFILLTSTLLISIIAKNISKPIISLTDQLDKISDMDLEENCDVDSRIFEIAQIARSIESLRHALGAFRKYVPAGLVKDLIATGETARIGGKNELLTVFFSDIKDFTTISEGLPPEYLGLHLSEYLDEMSKIVIECGGTIDKYIGDAIMAFWGAPHKDLDHEVNGCRAAVLCQKKLVELSIKWQGERKPMMHTRIGLHTGPTIVGNIGSTERMNYTVIGDSVNLAARLEGVNKIYNTGIIISQSTADRVKDHFAMRPLDVVRVKGKTIPVQIFELLDFLGDEGEEETQSLAVLHTKAFDLYMKANFKESMDILLQLEKSYPEDGPIQILKSRVQDLIENPPNPSDWSGEIDGLRVRDIKSK